METKEQFTPDFLIIPKEVMSMPPADRFIMGAVYFMSRLSLGKCIASNVELGRICGIKAHSVTASLDRLEEVGLIQRTFKDENKRHRDEIICLIGYGKLESSGLLKSSPLIKRLESSTKGHISNTISNNIYTGVDTPQTEFNSKEELLRWKASNQRWLHILGVYGLWRKVDSRLVTKATLNKLMPEFRKVATELADFTDDQLRQAFVKCDEMKDKNGQGFDWTLRTVKKVLLK